MLSVYQLTVHILTRSIRPHSHKISHTLIHLPRPTIMTFECSQASSSSPSLSSYPVEFRGATDYDQYPSNQYLLCHWNHAVKHYYCDECGSLVSTAGGITYHGATTTNQDVDSAPEYSDSDDSSCIPSITTSNRIEGTGRLYRSSVLKRNRPALVRMRPMYRLRLDQGAESC